MPHPVDLEVGRRIRYRRWMRGMSQQQLAQAIGIRFQQVQKYEAGENRVSASRLWDISLALEAPVGFFFREGTAPLPSGLDREAAELVRHFLAIPAPKRRGLLDLALSLGEPGR